MGLDDVLQQQIRDHAPDLKEKLVAEFNELTHDDMKQTGDDPERSSIAFSRRPDSRANRSSNAFAT